MKPELCLRVLGLIVLPGGSALARSLSPPPVSLAVGDYEEPEDRTAVYSGDNAGAVSPAWIVLHLLIPAQYSYTLLLAAHPLCHPRAWLSCEKSRATGTRHWPARATYLRAVALSCTVDYGVEGE